MAPAARPRPPGRPQSFADRLRGLNPASFTIPVIMTCTVGLLLILALPWLFSPKSDDLTEADRQTETAGLGTDRAATIELPLSLDEVGFPGGVVDPATATEGPGAASYCDHAPSIDGLSAWNANRLTEGGGRRRLAQLVAHFESSIHATTYLGAISGLIDCESWPGGTEDEPVTFTITEVTPSRVFADETKQFELQALRQTSVLYLRTYLIRSGHKVAQLTYVSPEPADLNRLQELTATAVAELGL